MIKVAAVLTPCGGLGGYRVEVNGRAVGYVSILGSCSTGAGEQVMDELQARETATQLELPIMGKLTQVRSPKGATIKERFDLFHAANPQVYQALVSTTRNILKRYNVQRISIKLPYEIVRWTRYLRTQGEEGYKLSNDFTAHYSRLIMASEPDLAHVFRTKVLRTK